MDVNASIKSIGEIKIMSRENCSRFVDHLRRFIGETVTVYTTSGGQSGDGFTGVVLSVNDDFLRLITRIGPAPGCALGSACDGRNRHRSCGCGCGRRHDDDNNFFNRVGSVTDIPIDRIASFVHNAV